MLQKELNPVQTDRWWTGWRVVAYEAHDYKVRGGSSGSYATSIDGEVDAMARENGKRLFILRFARMIWCRKALAGLETAAAWIATVWQATGLFPECLVKTAPF